VSANEGQAVKTSKGLLTLGGGVSFGMALYHVALAFSPALSEASGAGDELTSNPTLLLISGLVVAALFALCGAYGLAGAGRVRRVPLLRVGLLTIGGLCTLDGLTFVVQLLAVLGLRPSPQPVQPLALVASLAFLIIGLLYLSGTIAGWCRLRPEGRGYAAV
jgi:hypothetical protein